MMEEALHLPFLPGLDGEHGHRKRLFTNESEIMDIVNGFTDFDSILLNNLDADEDGSEDGLSWNEFQDIASELLDGTSGENWDFGRDSVMGIAETVLSELAGDTWLPIDFGDAANITDPLHISSGSLEQEVKTTPSVDGKPKVPVQTPPSTPVKQAEVKPKAAPTRKTSAPTVVPPLNYSPKVITSADLKILGNRSKQKTGPVAKFQAEEPDLKIVERSQNTAVVVKKKSIFRAGQSLLRLPIRAGSSASSFSSPASPGKTPSPSPVKQSQLLRNRTATGKPVHKHDPLTGRGPGRMHKPFIEVDHDYCSVHPDLEEVVPPPMLEIMDVETFQEEVVVGEEPEVHDRLPSYYTAVSTSKATEKISITLPNMKNSNKKKPAVAMPVQVQRPKSNKPKEKPEVQPSTNPVPESPSPQKKQKNPEVSEKRPKALLMPPKYQQVSYCEKILQIENDSEDELVDIEGVDESDTFDRLPPYVTNAKAVSPRKSRENKYIDKDEEYTPRKERQRGRKKKDRNKSTSPAKMKRKSEAIEQVREEKQKKRGRPPKKSEPERKKVKTKEKKKKGSKPTVLTDSESSDEDGLAKLSKPGAFEAIYSSDEEDDNNNDLDAKDPLRKEPEEFKESLQLEDEFPVKIEKETVEEYTTELEESRVRTVSWKSTNSYEDLSGTYQNELGFTIFGDFGEGDPTHGCQISGESIPEIPDSFPMDEIQMTPPCNEESVSDNQEVDVKEEAVEFEIEIMDLEGGCVSVDLNSLLKGKVVHDEDGEHQEELEEAKNGNEEAVADDKPVELRILQIPVPESDDQSSQSHKKQKRKLTLSDYLIRKEYEKNICSSTSRVHSPTSQDVEEGEIDDPNEANLEEAVRQLNFLPRDRKRRESEESDFYKKVKDHKRKRNSSCSSSSSSESYDSESSESSDSCDLRSRSPSPFLKARRKSRSRMRYSSSRSRRRGSYSTDSSSSDCSSSGRSRSRDSSSSSQERRRRRRSYSSYSDCSVSSYDVKSKSKRKDRSTSRSRSSDERRVIYLSGLPKNMNKRDIHKKFARFGPIRDIKIKFRSSGEPYAFVTFYDGCDALDAIEHGNDDKTKPKCEISFGGRRRFCRENYADLDSQADSRFSNKPLDFDALLRETKEKLTKRC